MKAEPLPPLPDPHKEDDLEYIPLEEVLNEFTDVINDLSKRVRALELNEAFRAKQERETKNPAHADETP